MRLKTGPVARTEKSKYWRPTPSSTCTAVTVGTGALQPFGPVRRPPGDRGIDAEERPAVEWHADGGRHVEPGQPLILRGHVVDARAAEQRDVFPLDAEVDRRTGDWPLRPADVDARHAPVGRERRRRVEIVGPIGRGADLIGADRPGHVRAEAAVAIGGAGDVLLIGLLRDDAREIVGVGAKRERTGQALHHVAADGIAARAGADVAGTVGDPVLVEPGEPAVAL